MELGSLKYTLVLDSTGLQPALDTATGKVADASNKIADSGDKAGNGIGDTIRKGAEVAGAAMAAVGGGLMVFEKQSTDFTVDYVKNAKAIARETGMTIEQASGLNAAFEHMGLSAEQAGTVFGIFSKQIVSASDKTDANAMAHQKLSVQLEATGAKIKTITDKIKDHGDKTGALKIQLDSLHATYDGIQQKLGANANAFDKLGISVLDGQGKQKDFNTILMETADKFKGMPNGVDKTAMSMQLFGRSGKDMVKILNLGSDGIQDLEKKATEMGLTLTDKTIGAVSKYITASKDLKESQDGLKISIGTLTAGPIAAMNERVATLIGKFQTLNPAAKDVVSNILAFGGPIATASGGFLALAAHAGQGLPVLTGLANKIPVLGSVMSSLGSVLTNPAFLIIAAIAAAVVLVVMNWGALGKIFEKHKPIIIAVGSALAAVGLAIFVTMLPAIGAAIASMAVAAVGFASMAVAAVGAAISTAAAWLLAAAPFIAIGLVVGIVAYEVVSHWKQVSAFFTGLWKEITLVFNYAVTNIKFGFQESIKFVQDVWKGIAGFFTGLWKGAMAIFDGVVKFFQKWGLTILAVIFFPFSIALGLIIANWKPISAFFQTIWNGIKAVFNVVAGFIVGFFRAEWNGLVNIWNAVSGFFKGVWNGIVKVFTPVIGWLVGLFKAEWNGIVNIWNAVSGFFKGVWDGIVKVFLVVSGWFGGIFAQAWENIKNNFKAVGEFFQGIWNTIVKIFASVGKAVGDAIGGAFKVVANTVIDTVQNTINGVFHLINGAIGIINKIPGVRIPVIADLKLPHLAIGTNNFQGGLAIMNEAGGELVNLPSGAQVIPADQTRKYMNNMSSKKTTNNNYNIGKVVLEGADATREFFGMTNRNIQLETGGISPLVGTAGTV